jgi:hypothetical protein
VSLAWLRLSGADAATPPIRRAAGLRLRLRTSELGTGAARHQSILATDADRKPGPRHVVPCRRSRGIVASLRDHQQLDRSRERASHGQALHARWRSRGPDRAGRLAATHTQCTSTTVHAASAVKVLSYGSLVSQGGGRSRVDPRPAARVIAGSRQAAQRRALWSPSASRVGIPLVVGWSPASMVSSESSWPLMNYESLSLGRPIEDIE